MLFFTVILKRP